MLDVVKVLSYVIIIKDVQENGKNINSWSGAVGGRQRIFIHSNHTKATLLFELSLSDKVSNQS